MELAKSDLNFVLGRCPRDIVKLLKEHPGKLFLAGGFIRSTIAGEKVSDIDLFGETPDFLLAVAKDLTLARKGRYFSTKNAFTVLSPPRIPVQLITRWLFNDPQKVIESFDFTVCQAAVWAEDTTPGSTDDGKKTFRFRSAISEAFYPDLAARRLVYTHPIRNEDAGGSLMRAIKFVRKGYNIQAPSLAGVVARLALAFEGKDRSEKWVTTIMTGLLREVDPLTVIDGVDFVDEHEVVEEGTGG